MKVPAFRLERLHEGRDRASFECGTEPLDRYFRTQVTQDIRRRVATCFVAIESSSDQIAAYYTLSATSIPLADLPQEETKRLPRYPTVPAIRIGRLAVDRRYQGRGLGAAMLADATARAVDAEIAACMLVVDAKDEQAVAFYRRHEFRMVESSSRTLFLPIATAQKLFR
jgi:ribosomal protein S18 acetylase RimI-like enzyme